MKKALLKFIIFTIIIIIVLSINAIVIAPKKLNIRFETLSDSSIPQSMNDVTIVFFTDLHFNNFVDDDRLDNAINKINELHPDLVLFGGDLIDLPTKNILSSSQKEVLIEQLSSIDAPLGKYAVYGNHDLESENSRIQFDEIMSASNFEVLVNTAMQIRNNNNEFINIIGIDSMALGSPNIDSSYQNISSSNYTIALCHTPDIFDDLPKDLTNYLLAGHSHGGQIYFPIIGSIYRPYGSEYYLRGKYNNGRTTLDINNGIGTTKYDVRLFADAEIVHYTLKNIAIEMDD